MSKRPTAREIWKQMHWSTKLNFAAMLAGVWCAYFDFLNRTPDIHWCYDYCSLVQCYCLAHSLIYFRRFKREAAEKMRILDFWRDEVGRTGREFFETAATRPWEVEEAQKRHRSACHRYWREAEIIYPAIKAKLK